MKTIQSNTVKTSSVFKNIEIGEELYISDKLSIVNGSALLVSIVEVNQKYNKIELKSGRIVKLSKHDKILCAIGSRMASDGMCGIIPEGNVNIGTEIAVLNIGGLVGQQISYNKSIGSPTYCKIIGQVVLKDGANVNITEKPRIQPSSQLNNKIPIVGYVGTSMNSGKTTVMSDTINIMKNNGIKIAAIKVTGVAAQKDIYSFTDYGASIGLSFLDCGLLSTCCIDKDRVIQSTKGLINHCNQLEDVDIIFLEFGDCLYGQYNVKELFEDNEIKKAISGLVLCAYDIPGSLKLYEDFSSMGMETLMLSGPVTNNIYTLNHSLKTMNINVQVFDNLGVNINIGALNKITNLLDKI
jgi:hypothetical protein